MSCSINFIIGGEEFSIDTGLNSSDVSTSIDKQLFEIIKNSGQWELILDKLKDSVRSNIQNNKVKLDQFLDIYDQEQVYAVANTTCDKLCDMYPTIMDWPKDVDLSQERVLFVKDIEDYKDCVILVGADGKRIFLIDSKRKNIQKLAKYLKIEKALNDDILSHLDEESNDYKILQSILNYVKDKGGKKFERINSIKDLLLHFISNKSSYLSLKENFDGKSVYRILNNFIPEIEGLCHQRQDKFSGLLGEFYFKLRFGDDKVHVKDSDLFRVLSQDDNISKLLKDYKIISGKQLSELMHPKISSLSEKDKETVIGFLKQFLQIDEIPDDVDVSGYNILLNHQNGLLNTQRGFPFKFSYSRGNKLYLNSTYYALKDTYGITFDTIVMMNKIQYREWNIYENNEKYYISKYNLLEESYSKEYESLEEAQKAIDKKIEDSTFGSNFMLNILRNLNNFEHSSQIRFGYPIQIGSIIELPNIKGIQDLVPKGSESMITSYQHTMKDFYKLVESYPDKIRNYIKKQSFIMDDINYAGLFMLMFSNTERTYEDAKAIVKKLRSASTRYFYLDSKNYAFNTARLIEVSSEHVYLSDQNEIAKLGEHYPIVKFWQSTADALKETFGVNLNVLTQQEISDTFGEDFANQKAFIKGDQIYINSTIASTEDLFHEYSHIILGYLKIKNPEQYISLLEKVWELTNDYDKRNINMLYDKYSYIDKLEENFVKQFSKYAIERQGNSLKEFFDEGEVLDAVNTIFDENNKDLIDFGNMSISKVFSRFSTEISKALQDNQTMFKEFAGSDEFRMSVKKTNLLKQWIDKGTVQEDCK